MLKRLIFSLVMMLQRPYSAMLPVKGRGSGLTACHTLLKLSPVTSPGFWSLSQNNSGLQSHAHCFVPSSRVTTVQSPPDVSLALAISGGQLVAHWPLQTLLPEPVASLSNV